MILSGIFIAILVLAAGAAIKVFLDRSGNELSITAAEFAIGAALCCLIIIPLTLVVGVKQAKASAVGGYREYFGGYETAATVESERCFRYRDEDGGDCCAHHYPCGGYWKTVYYTENVSDGNGGYTTETKSRQEHHTIYCPETTEELNYFVDTTLGRYTIASNLLPLHPYRYEYDHDGSIPRSALDDAYVPSFWTKAKARIAAGKPGGVVKSHTYSNYVLASQNTILTKFSGSIDRYLKAGLLPKVQQKILFPYIGQKVYWVGKPLANAAVFQETLNRFNGALGSDKHGDLHLLVIHDSRVSDPDEWFGALQAYWFSKRLGKSAISKNAIILAVGTSDGQTVSWARAATGMPVGNDALFVKLQESLKGASLSDPEAFLGAPEGVANTAGDVTITHTQGLVEQAVWGPDGYQRICMICKSKDDKGVGYGYLSGEIQPSGRAKMVIAFLAFFFSMFVWAGFVAFGVREGGAANGLLRSGTSSLSSSFSRFRS